MTPYATSGPRSLVRPHASRERGASVASLLVALTMLVTGLTTALLVSTISSMTAQVTRARTERRIAAEAILASSAVAAAALGGSIAPDAPEPGYSDAVVFDERSGELVAREPGSGAAITRQWRVRATEDGGRLLEVSAQHESARGTSRATTYFASRRLE